MKIILTILTILMLFPASVFAETVGFFSKIEGRVDILKEGAARAASINLNDPVSLGDIVRTKSDGKAEITFKDDTTVRVAPESRLKIDEYAFNPDNTRNKGVLNLFRGKIRAVVSKSKAIIPIGATSSSFDVNTPTAIAGVRGSALFVFHDRGITGVIFTEGQGFVVNPNVPERVVNVSAGQVTFVVKPDAPPLAPRPASNIELAVHTKDTTSQEKPKEKKEEGDKQKEDKKQVKEAKAGDKDKKDEGKKDEGKPAEEKKTAEAAPAAEAAASVDINAAVTGTLASVDIASASTSTATLTTRDGGTLFGYIAPTEIIIPDIISPIDSVIKPPTDTLIPITESVITPLTLPPPTPDAFIGLMYPDNSGYPSYCTYNCGNFASLPWNATYTDELTQNGFMNGSFAGTDSFWIGPATFYATGAYSNPNNKPLWFSETEGIVANGSEFYGFTMGINLSNYLEGGMVAIYIRPDGTTGYLTSNNATGFFDPAYGIWAASGTLTSQQMGSTTVLPSQLYDYSPSLDYGKNYGNIGGDIAGNVATEHVSIIDQNWGIWTGYGGGTFGALPAQNWTAKIGGETYDDYDVFDGYFLGNITGTEWLNGKLKGTVNGKYLSYYELGQFDGKVLGTYYDYLEGGDWHATSLGTYTETPLAWSGKIAADSNAAGLYSMDTWSYWLDIEGASTGLMGGVASPWSGTTAVNYMGKYDVSLGIGYGPPFLWTPEIYSYNANNLTNTTYDNGMYKGFIGGVWKGDNTIDAKVYSLYIDPAGNAGILKGSVTGAYYPQINMFEADGTWTPTALTTGLDAGTATVNVVSTNYGYSITSLGDFNGSGSITVAGNEVLTATDWRYSITGQDWGIWKSIIGGDYIDLISDIWSLSTTVNLGQTIYGTQTDGYLWSNNQVAGTTYGYGADITAAPITWISVGETIGTFDPATYTWQTVQLSAWIETNKFLAMRQTSEGQTALTQLNIPFVEVGRTNLTGSGTMGAAPVNVYMNDTTFFAYSNGASPKIWATNAVGGNYQCSACGPTTVGLTGANGLGANFNIQTFDTVSGKWTATVDGGGTYTGTGSMNGTAVLFNGAAAGTNTGIGPGTFSGTAAGVAK